MSAAGKQLQVFLRERYGNQKNACRNLRICESYLSQVIKGKRKPNFKLLNRLEELEFDTLVFDKEVKLENYLQIDTSTDYQLIVSELRRIIISKNLIIRGLEMLNRNLQKEISRKDN